MTWIAQVPVLVLQYPLQQSSFLVHLAPRGSHVVLLGVHEPLTQTPSQQSASAVSSSSCACGTNQEGKRGPSAPEGSWIVRTAIGRSLTRRPSGVYLSSAANKCSIDAA